MLISNAVFDSVESLPPLRDIIASHDLRATKALGQNFLCDLNLTRKIARQGDIQSKDYVIEIGPGPGGLTRGILLEGAQNLTAIEFDVRAIRALESLKQAAGNRLNLIHSDALKINMMDFGDNGTRKIIANLPYNIATPLIIQWLKHIHEYGADAYRSITVMVQREVAERICAADNTKHYGRLGVMAGWLCHVRICFDVPPSAFVPAPKVVSSIIHLTPKPRKDNIDFKIMEKIVESAFGQRRKTIRQSLKPYAAAVEAAGIDNNLRAENLTIHDFLNIAKAAI